MQIHGFITLNIQKDFKLVTKLGFFLLLKLFVDKQIYW